MIARTHLDHPLPDTRPTDANKIPAANRTVLWRARDKSAGPFFAIAAVFGWSLFANPASAQDALGIADREIARRQADVVQADQLLKKGERAAANKDFEAAYLAYLDALDKIPSGSATSGQRSDVVSQFSGVALQYAESLIDQGRYTDAERVAKTILLPQYDPQNRAAVRLLSRLEQPDHFNKTVTPQFAADREQVKKLLMEAQGFFDAGRFDLAMKRYEQVLLVDRYNSAARVGMERLNKKRSEFDAASYNETRSRLLWLSDEAWERPVNKNLKARATESGSSARTNERGTEAITAKLNRIIIPKIELRDTSVREAVEYLKQRSRDLDTSTQDGQQKRGVNIVLKLNPSAQPAAQTEGAEGAAAPDAAPAIIGGSADTLVTMTLSHVPLIEALRYLTEQAHLKYKIEPYAVSIVPVTENTTEMVTREFSVPPGFIPASSVVEGATTSPQGDTMTEARVKGRPDAKAYLTQMGVPFPTGAFAQYLPIGSRLIVRNTPDALDFVEYLVDNAQSGQPTQVEIESKFLEVSQNNLSELGFDWMLGPVAIGGGTYGAGGTQGYSQAVDPTVWPFGGVGSNPVTGGLRSGMGTGPNAAVTANSIDALIAGVPQGAMAAAPGIFGLAGIFTNPQFQVVIRALSNKKGVDLMSAPKVSTKSGRKAVVKVVREFPYPTEFNPPQVPAPTTGGSSTTTTVLVVVSTSSPVTPATPTAFEVRNVGVTLEVEPIIGPDNYTIELTLSPEVVEFDGFIDYGSPVIGPTFNPLDVIGTGIGTFELTPNTINQPIFSTRKVTTKVDIWDGQTVGLGGLIRQDIQKTQDKVPILGDIPVAGRLFRSDVDQTIKRNLLIFVTARIMDAEGRPVRQDDLDQEEIVDPLGLPPDLPPPAYAPAKFGK